MLVRWLINALALFLTAYIIQGIHIDGVLAGVMAALLLCVVNAIIRPILLIFTLPLNILTLGLFTFVINALMLLLVAAVVDGVLTSGMQQPHWYPAGWQAAAQTIGGNLADGGRGGYETGGLQAALFYFPDNPGGIADVPLGKIPSGTQTDVTAFVIEIAGVPAHLSVDATGASTSGATSTTDTVVSTVRTSGTLPHAPDLVRNLCSRAVVLADGEMIGMGSPGEAVRLFRERLLDERAGAGARRYLEGRGVGPGVAERLGLG